MQETFTFFASSTSVFSQWYDKAPFRMHGIAFRTAEHFMMWSKAKVFDAPDAMLSSIVNAAHPREAKALGRRIASFDARLWDQVGPSVVAAGNYAKFSQNPHALVQLIQTVGTTLVEAAPWDRIWGIGLSADDPRAQRRETWLGENRLGQELTGIGVTLAAVSRLPAETLEAARIAMAKLDGRASARSSSAAGA